MPRLACPAVREGYTACEQAVARSFGVRRLDGALTWARSAHRRLRRHEKAQTSSAHSKARAADDRCAGRGGRVFLECGDLTFTRWESEGLACQKDGG